MISWMNLTPHLSFSWPSPLPLPVHLVLWFLPHLQSPPGSSKASKWTLQSLRSPKITSGWTADSVMLLQLFKSQNKSLNPNKPSSQPEWVGLAVGETPLSRDQAPVALPSLRGSVLGLAGGSQMTLKTLRTRGLRLRIINWIIITDPYSFVINTHNLKSDLQASVP